MSAKGGMRTPLPSSSLGRKHPQLRPEGLVSSCRSEEAGWTDEMRTGPLLGAPTTDLTLQILKGLISNREDLT